MPRCHLSIRALSCLLVLFAIGACRASEDAPEGIRPEISALPPAMRAPSPAQHVGETWNSAQIDWQPYDAGLARAKAENKPVCLVLYTGWCPHCRAYSHVFDDARVVARAKDLVMIRANADEESELASRYAKDGSYIPRTFFLALDGTLLADIHAPRPKFQYFFDEKDPAPLLAAMETAVKRAAR